MIRKKMERSLAKMMGAATLALGSTFAMVACSDDSSSGTFDLDEPFEIVLSKAKYSYDEDNSSFVKIVPVCKTGTLGNLVGPDDKGAEWDTVTYKVTERKGVVTAKKGKKEVAKYSFDGESFPVGFWGNSEEDGLKILSGLRLDDDDIVSMVSQYNGSCFMKDYYALFRKGNSALEEVDQYLTDFYNLFKAPRDTSTNEKKMLADIRVGSCEELTIYDGLVSVEVSDLKESSGKITISYEDDECPVTFNLRYAINQEDCEAAFEDFQNDRYAAKKFNFDTYANDIVYDEYCVAQLVLDLKRDKKIPLAKWVPVVDDEAKAQAKSFARGLVNLVQAGLAR